MEKDWDWGSCEKGQERSPFDLMLSESVQEEESEWYFHFSQCPRNTCDCSEPVNADSKLDANFVKKVTPANRIAK